MTNVDERAIAKARSRKRQRAHLNACLQERVCPVCVSDLVILSNTNKENITKYFCTNCFYGSTLKKEDKQAKMPLKVLKEIRDELRLKNRPIKIEFEPLNISEEQCKTIAKIIEGRTSSD